MNLTRPFLFYLKLVSFAVSTYKRDVLFDRVSLGLTAFDHLSDFTFFEPFTFKNVCRKISIDIWRGLLLWELKFVPDRDFTGSVLVFLIYDRHLRLAVVLVVAGNSG